MEFFVMKVGTVDEPEATLFDPVDVSPIGPAPLCSACGGPVGMLTWQPPFAAELEPWGNAYGDIAFGPGYDYLISSRLKSLILKEGIVGALGLEAVNILRVRRRCRRLGPPPAYFRMGVALSRTAVDLRASGANYVQKPRCRECRVGTFGGVRRVVFEANTLGGEDVFLARGLPGTVIVTARFRDLCETNEIRNAFFVPIEEFSFQY